MGKGLPALLFEKTAKIGRVLKTQPRRNFLAGEVTKIGEPLRLDHQPISDDRAGSAGRLFFYDLVQIVGGDGKLGGIVGAAMQLLKVLLHQVEKSVN